MARLPLSPSEVEQLTLPVDVPPFQFTVMDICEKPIPDPPDVIDPPLTVQEKFVLLFGCPEKVYVYDKFAVTQLVPEIDAALIVLQNNRGHKRPINVLE